MAQAKTAQKATTGESKDSEVKAQIAPKKEEISPIAKVARETPKQMSANKIQPEGTAWGRWAVMALAEHKIKDALHPLYLYNRAEQFQPGDYVEIKHPFGYWVVCLDIVRVDRQSRGIVSYPRHIFDYKQDGRLITPNLTGAEVQHLGAQGWSVVHGRHVVAEDFPTQEAAEEWLKEREAA